MSTKARQLDRFPPEWQNALRRAQADPGNWHEFARGIPDAGLKNQQNNLDSLKAGLRQWHGLAPELSKAALERRIHFRKVISGNAHWGFDVMIDAVPKRPSEIAREYLAALARGEKPREIPD